DLTAVAGILNSSIMIILSFSHLVINLNLMKIILFLISFLSAHIIIYLIYFLISCLSLFFVNADTYADWLMEATDFDRYPAEIYSDFLRFFLLFALPILFFAYVPVAILLDKLSGYYAGLGLVVIFVLYLISTIVWRLGLKNYQSASS
ncbi:MAG: ABC transporter permease, partial [Patescibacteria group bacterium]|nr:ABC transporter permease [Patescibacteria group bacterium]